MAKTMKITAISASILTVCFSLLCRFTSVGAFFSLAITAGTVAYHFIIRLLIGEIFNRIMHNRVDYTKRWFCVGEAEMKLYRILKVKKWKDKMPTYDEDTFDTSKHTWDEIVQAMCQSELVHETNVIFSFLPVFASVWFGSFGVFLLTSLLAAAFDLMFVFMQRFNRCRILRVKARKKRGS